MNADCRSIEKKTDLYVYLMLNFMASSTLVYYIDLEHLILKLSAATHLLVLFIITLSSKFLDVKRAIILLVNKFFQIIILTQLLFYNELNDKSTLFLFMIADNQLIKQAMNLSLQRLYTIFLYLTLFLASVRISSIKQSFDSVAAVSSVIFFVFVDFHQDDSENKQPESPIGFKNIEPIEQIDVNNGKMKDFFQSPKESFKLDDIPNQGSKLVVVDSAEDSFNMNEKADIDKPNIISNQRRDHQSMNIQLRNISQQSSIEQPRSCHEYNQFQPIKDNMTINFLRGNQFRDEEDLQNVIWRTRLNGIPLGIVLMEKTTNQVVFTNPHFKILFSKTLQVEPNREFDTLLRVLQFRILDSINFRTQTINSKATSLTQFYKSKRTLKTLKDQEYDQISLNSTMKKFTKKKNSVHSKHSKQERSSVSVVEQDDDILSKRYTLEQILDMIECGDLSNFINQQERTLEMCCTYQKNTQINLKLVLDQMGDYMLIIQDYTKQNELQKSEEQNQFKSRVIESFSHDLRTPLNSAFLFLKSSLLDDRVPLFIRTTFIIPSLSALFRQKYLINDIIDFSHLNADVFEQKIQEFTILEIIQELTELFYHEFSTKKLGLSFDVGVDCPYVIKSDQTRLMQILVNLIQNSQKFSNTGYVCVRINAGRNRSIKFTVQDEGIGIEPTKLKGIQQILAAQNFSGSVNQEWSGFGLIISQMLVRNLGPAQSNDIKIHSEGPNKGTSVSFEIMDQMNDIEQPEGYSPPQLRLFRYSSEPLFDPRKGLMITIKGKGKSKLLLADVNMKEHFYAIPSELNILNDDINQVGEVENKMAQAQNGALSNFLSVYELNQRLKYNFNASLNNSQADEDICNCLTILSIDDEAFNQTSLKLMLECLKFEVDVAYNGVEAIEMIKNKRLCSPYCRRYQLIISDVQMPVMDGLETSKRLNAMMRKQEIQYIPIIGLTAFNSSKDIDQCIQSGMNHVLSKPLNLKYFREILDKLQIQVRVD